MLHKGFLFLLILMNLMVQVLPASARNLQQPRKIIAVRTEKPPKIDGKLDEHAWSMAMPATGFLQYEPHNDRPASLESSVWVLYDDNALFIGAFLYDSAPDSILRELGLRDSGDQLNADRFWVDINPFNDGINGFRFQVSASGVQTDSNMSGAGSSGGGGQRGDRNWDAVWVSAVGKKENGWVVEMEIPYAALRFPKGDVHEWGINFWREIRRTRETSSWNFVNRRVGDVMASMGVMNGIYGIEPPIRLALFPYLSNYMEKNGGRNSWTNSFNGGVDLKWGISPSFTMDVTLIPDFGQVQSDALVLNLSPYEVKYDENRQFFTEGTELFGKADLLYSRRIGARPKNYSKASQERAGDEIVTYNPIETRLINASKISGRTSSGLGLGIFNAMTAASHATLLDTLSGYEREVVTQPFTNYNLVVVDQSLPNNSYVSLINTNVSGSMDGYMANVSGTEFRFLDKTNMFRISGSAAISQQYHRNNENIYGHKYNLNLGKVGGTWQYGYSRSVVSDTYDQNDMGFMRRNNLISDGVSVSYNVFTPVWRLWNYSTSLSAEYNRLFNPQTFTGFSLGYSTRVLFDTRLFVNLRTTYRPLGNRDYFEPRVPGRFYETPASYNTSLSYSSDYRRRIYVDGSFSYGKTPGYYNQSEYQIDFRPTFRASDRMNISAGSRYSQNINDIGYVGRDFHSGDVYFGMRNAPTLTQTLGSTYIFSNSLSLDFALRHYWSRAIYNNSYFILQTDGIIAEINDYPGVPDINYNAFTIDMKLTWNFAPGSQLTAVWKNIIDQRKNTLPESYRENLGLMFGEDQINSFSIKVLYYLDYHSLRRK